MSIARDTRNITVNLTAEEKAAIGKIAYAEGVALGAWIRNAILDKMERHHPETAAELTRIRIARCERNAAIHAELSRRRMEQLTASP